MSAGYCSSALKTRPIILGKKAPHHGSLFLRPLSSPSIPLPISLADSSRKSFSQAPFDIPANLHRILSADASSNPHTNTSADFSPYLRASVRCLAEVLLDFNRRRLLSDQVIDKCHDIME
jgi:hypothetical protein